MKRDTKLVKICVDYITSFLGKPYIWGGQSPLTGFDCSGLCMEMLKAGGLVRDGEDYSSHALFIKYQHTQNIDKGVLVFYGKPEKINHVGICLNDKLMIEAGNGGKEIRTFEDARSKNSYVRIRPINRRNDIVGFNDPFIK